jgi:hypothetical protein
MKPVALLLLSLVAFRGHAQAPAATRQDSAIQLTVLQNGRYASAVYTVNREPLTPATVTALLRRYPPAAAELRKGRAQRLLGLGVLLPVFVAATIVGGRQADQQRNAPGSPFSKAPVPFSISLGAFVGSLYLGVVSNTHFAKAIEIYNRRFP